MLLTDPVAVRASEGGNRMPAAPAGSLVEILLVEDSPDHADLMIEALNEGTLRIKINLVENGADAVAYLRRQDAFAGATLPDLILLDLGLPRMNGHEVLAEIKGDEHLRRIPIVILTGSLNEEDFVRAYDLQANCCVAKPQDLEEFTRAVQMIERFWRTVPRRS